MNKKIRVIIADDHRIVRAGIKQIIEECPDMAQVDEAGDGHELIAKVRKNSYDAILLDVAMPGRDGLDILKQLKAEKCPVPVLMLSVYPEEQYAIRALRAGASGYLTKAAAPETLIEAIRKITGGKKYITETIAEHLADIIDRESEKPPHESLSDREFQILCRIASGKPVSAIASEMFLNVKTVSTYRRRILDKMKMKNNSELTHYALKNRLLD
ncbi:MAG TPA: response regulator transcription factor [Spirochaetota bacterium]|nr:response regulator transcription factor [Spirochaetota bacterium]HPV40094.1 response regulator transcription factor [Spirochaetota bacterium]